MAMSAGRQSGSGDDELGEAHAPLAEINVTPMVDVMLVLLIIFMITAPLMVAGVPVNLPNSSAAAPAGTADPVVVSVDNSGRLFLADAEVDIDRLIAALIDLYKETPDATVQVRGDRQIQYGRVMEVVDAIGLAGFGKIALISRPLPAGGD